MSVNPPIPPKPFYSTAICLQKSQLNIGKVELQTRSFLLFLITYLKRVIITLFPSQVNSLISGEMKDSGQHCYQYSCTEAVVYS